MRKKVTTSDPTTKYICTSEFSDDPEEGWRIVCKWGMEIFFVDIKSFNLVAHEFPIQINFHKHQCIISYCLKLYTCISETIIQMH